MVKVLRQFTVRKLKEPLKKSVDEDIEWICNSLGFITPRDQEKTAYVILKSLVEASRKGTGLTSEELSKKVNPTVGSVIYHLKRLMKAGLVVKFESHYELRMNSLVKTIDEIEKEVVSTLEDIKKISEDIDEKIGLENRM